MTTTADDVRARTAEMTPANVTTFTRYFGGAGFDAQMAHLRRDPKAYGETFCAWLDQARVYAECLAKAQMEGTNR